MRGEKNQGSAGGFSGEKRRRLKQVGGKKKREMTGAEKKRTRFERPG